MFEYFGEKKFVNPYVARTSEYAPWIFNEEAAAKCRGTWQNVFATKNPVHVEIGTGNGSHFATYAAAHSQVSVVGFELKYKTLVQSIAHARRRGCDNARMIKADARPIGEFFADGEVSKFMIYFPDPWPKLRQQKNRLLNTEFFNNAYKALKDGGEFEFKTDHPGYFEFATDQAQRSKFHMDFYTENLHKSEKAPANFVTHFESLFLRKGQPIYYFLLKKDEAREKRERLVN